MSLRKSVDAMCKNCAYDKLAEGTWREQVQNCAVTSCPLFEHRPMTGVAINARRAEKRGIDITVVQEEEEESDEALAA